MQVPQAKLPDKNNWFDEAKEQKSIDNQLHNKVLETKETDTNSDLSKKQDKDLADDMHKTATTDTQVLVTEYAKDEI